MDRSLLTRRRLTAAATLLALAMACGLTAASAAPAPPAPRSKVQDSPSFAGYAVTEAGRHHITSASLTFTVPKITCHQRYSGVGPSLLINSTVTKNTYTLTGGGISIACENSTVVYTALPVVDSVYQTDTAAITPGDKITVKVTYGARTSVTLTDDTTKASNTFTGKKSTGESAYMGDSGLTLNHTNLGVDKFTKTSFSGAAVNGTVIGRDRPTRYEWVDKKTVLVAPSALAHENAFTTSFEHAR